MRALLTISILFISTDRAVADELAPAPSHVRSQLERAAAQIDQTARAIERRTGELRAGFLELSKLEATAEAPTTSTPDFARATLDMTTKSGRLAETKSMLDKDLKKLGELTDFVSRTAEAEPAIAAKASRASLTLARVLHARRAGAGQEGVIRALEGPPFQDAETYMRPGAGGGQRTQGSKPRTVSFGGGDVAFEPGDAVTFRFVNGEEMSGRLLENARGNDRLLVIRPAPEAERIGGNRLPNIVHEVDPLRVSDVKIVRADGSVLSRSISPLDAELRAASTGGDFLQLLRSRLGRALRGAGAPLEGRAAPRSPLAQ